MNRYHSKEGSVADFWLEHIWDQQFWCRDILEGVFLFGASCPHASTVSGFNLAMPRMVWTLKQKLSCMARPPFVNLQNVLASSWSKIKCFQFTELSNDWLDPHWMIRKNGFQWLIACLLFKNFRHNIDPHGSPYIWKAFIHLLVRDAGALKFFPWLPLLRPIWIQRPRHPRPGLQGWGSETTKFAGSFCENTGVPVFVVRNLCLPKDLTWAFSSDRRSSLRGWFPRLSSSS